MHNRLMSSLLRRLAAQLGLRVLARARWPVLLLAAAALFLADLIVPDVIPVVDEILLGIATVLLARWRTASSS